MLHGNCSSESVRETRPARHNTGSIWHTLTHTSPLPPSPQAVAPVLDDPNEPVSDLSYFDCLDVVVEKSQVSQWEWPCAGVRGQHQSLYTLYYIYMYSTCDTNGFLGV